MFRPDKLRSASGQIAQTPTAFLDGNTILTVTEEKTVTSEFLLSYILPLFAFDFTQWKSVALFLIFFLTLGFLCVKHETFTVNIVLEVFGYQFYRCDLEDEDGNGITWMIISRTDLKGCVGDSVYLRPLNNECRLNASTRWDINLKN